jgi:hypothetical protein
LLILPVTLDTRPGAPGQFPDLTGVTKQPSVPQPVKLVTMRAQETRWDEFTRIKRNLFLTFLSLFVVWLPLDSWLRVHPAYSFLSWTALIMLGAFGYYFQRYVHWQCPRCSRPFQQSAEWTFYGPWTVWPRKKCANCGLGLRENPTPA